MSKCRTFPSGKSSLLTSFEVGFVIGASTGGATVATGGTAPWSEEYSPRRGEGHVSLISE